MAIAKLNKTVVAGERARATDYNLVTGKVDEVIDAVNNKAEKSHTHSISQVSGLSSALNDKADIDHEHSASDIVGLDAAIKAIGGIASYTKQFVTDGLKLTITCLNGNTFTVTIPFATFSEYFETYEPGILSEALTKHLVRSMYYVKDVDTEADLPTFSNSHIGESYRVASNGNMYTRLASMLKTIHWVWHIKYSDKSVSSDTIDGENTVTNVRSKIVSDEAWSLDSRFTYGKYYEYNNKKYLAACDSSGNLMLQSGGVLVYVVDPSNTSNLLTAVDVRNVATTGVTPFSITIIRTDREFTNYWFKVPGSVITSDIGNGEAADSGSTDSGSTDSGSTDSGGSSSSDTSDWGTFELNIRLDSSIVPLTVTQNGKTKTLTMADAAANSWAKVMLDTSHDAVVHASSAKNWWKSGGSFAFAENTDTFTLSATTLSMQSNVSIYSV